MGKSSAAPGGSGVLPEGFPALRGPLCRICSHYLLAAYAVHSKSRRKGKGNVYRRENPEVEMTEANFARV